MHLSSKLLLKIDGLPVLAACLWGRVEGARRRRVRWSQGVRIKALAEILSLWPPSARVSAFDFLVPRGDIGSRARLHFTFLVWALPVVDVFPRAAGRG